MGFKRTHINKGQVCCIKGCENEAHAKGLCDTHYSRIAKGYEPDHCTIQRWTDPYEKRIFHLAKARAKKKSLPFNLTAEDAVIPEVCPILGIKLNKNNTKIKDDSPSLDRIKPALGYVKGNVQVISCLANRIKTNAEPWQIKRVAAFLEANHVE